MPQYPYGYNSGGFSTALNLQPGANLVKASPGRIMRLSVNTVGTAGTFSVNDSATTAGAAAANLVFSAINTTAAGTEITLEAVCNNGIVVTVPTGGVVAAYYS